MEEKKNQHSIQVILQPKKKLERGRKIKRKEEKIRPETVKSSRGGVLDLFIGE